VPAGTVATVGWAGVVAPGFGTVMTVVGKEGGVMTAGLGATVFGLTGVLTVGAGA
jgi:hypothetical protein